MAMTEEQKARRREYDRRYRKKRAERLREYHRDYYAKPENRKRHLERCRERDGSLQGRLRMLRLGAKRRSLPFSLTHADLEAIMPKGGTPCPVCCTPMYRGTKHNMSVDRRDNEIGYVPGNVEVICKWCNERKRDLDAWRLHRLAMYADGLLGTKKPAIAGGPSFDEEALRTFFGPASAAQIQATTPCRGIAAGPVSDALLACATSAESFDSLNRSSTPRPAQ
jgi:hypothetical protein